jgi:broad specificity phosphatase PhoE
MHKLILLRHGESAWNREDRFTGLDELDDARRSLRHEYLGDPGQVRKAQEAVVRQGKVAGRDKP